MNISFKKIFSAFVICGMLCSLSTSLWSFQDGPYAGLALQWQNLSGNRQDQIIIPGETPSVYNTQDLDNNKLGFEAFGGCLYPCFNDCVLVGYEGYLAYDFNKDGATGLAESSIETSSLQRKFNAGILLKGGIVVYNDYFIYGLVGPDIGYFHWKQTELNTSNSFGDKQALVGVRFGTGIERDFCCFRVGLQVDYTHYNPKTFFATDSDGDTRESHFKPNILNVGIRVSVPLQ